MNNLDLFLKLINERLVNNKCHPFNSQKKYFDDFIGFLKRFPYEALYDSRRKRESLLTKLQLCSNTQYNPLTYCQGISEIVMYFNALQQGLSFTPEKKLTDNNTDIDIQICTDIATYNIEIKSPTFSSSINNPGILIENLFRTTKINWTKELENIEHINIKKNDDNKLCEYLKSAQTKFCNSSSSICNILFIALPITEIQRFFGYISNGYSGLFVTNPPIQLLSPVDFDKTDVIILSNIVDGHTFSYNNINSSWMLNEYFNLMISSPFKSIDSSVAQELLNIIPN